MGEDHKEITRAAAADVLTHLNTKASRSFRPTPDTLKDIVNRLSEVENDVDGVKVMIDRMCARWKTDPEMCEYLRPSTLFRKSKFHGYYDDRNMPVRGARAVVNYDKGF